MQPQDMMLSQLQVKASKFGSTIKHANPRGRCVVWQHQSAGQEEHTTGHTYSTVQPYLVYLSYTDISYISYLRLCIHLSQLLKGLDGGLGTGHSVHIDVLSSRQSHSFRPAAHGIGHNPLLHVLSVLPGLHQSSMHEVDLRRCVSANDLGLLLSTQALVVTPNDVNLFFQLPARRFLHCLGACLVISQEQSGISCGRLAT